MAVVVSTVTVQLCGKSARLILAAISLVEVLVNVTAAALAVPSVTVRASSAKMRAIRTTNVTGRSRQFRAIVVVPSVHALRERSVISGRASINLAAALSKYRALVVVRVVTVHRPLTAIVGAVAISLVVVLVLVAVPLVNVLVARIFAGMMAQQMTSVFRCLLRMFVTVAVNTVTVA